MVKTGKTLLEVLAMSLNGGGQGPEVHAVGPDADGPAASAGAERENLVEAIKQAEPLLRLDEPLELWAVGGELGPGQPLSEKLQCLFLKGRVRLDRLKTLPGLLQQLHDLSSQELTMTSLPLDRQLVGTLPRLAKQGNLSKSGAGPG